MRKIFYGAVLLTGAVVALYFLPVRQDSALYGIKSFVVEKGASIRMSRASSADIQQELHYKKEELRAYEDAIIKIDAADEQMRADAPVCPTTGEKAIVTISSDPRTDLREKIQRLENEIAALESRI
ncbi:MAG: hypothetical protein HYV24_02065 [Deltaproteobacteria bacterium]|nr:hypothetical protein [Deltaproteobacteria bacterium]